MQSQLQAAHTENDALMTESLDKDEELEELQGQLSRAIRASQVMIGTLPSVKMSWWSHHLLSINSHPTESCPAALLWLSLRRMLAALLFRSLEVPCRVLSCRRVPEWWQIPTW